MGMRMYPVTNIANMERLANVPQGTAEVLKRLESMSLQELCSPEVIKVYGMNFVDPNASITELTGYVTADDDYARYLVMETVFLHANRYDSFLSCGWGKPNSECYALLEHLQELSHEDIELESGLAFVKQKANIHECLRTHEVIRPGLIGFTQDMFDEIEALNFN